MRIVSLFTDRKTVKRTVGIIAGIVIFAGGTAVFGFVVPVSLFYVIAIGAVCQLVYAFLGKKLPEFAGVLYRSGIIPVVLTVAIMVSGVSTMKDIQRTEYTLKSAKVSEKTKIVFLSDVHLGTTMDIKGFYKLSERIVDEKPDAIIIGGDWFDQGTTNEDMFTAAAIMGNIKTENGVYYVYGNHDMDTGVFVPIRKDGGFTAITSSGAGGWGLAVRTQGVSEYVCVNIVPES